MNWCKTCKKELPMEASCNIAPECSVCRANRLQRELEQAQRERDEALDNLAKQKHEYLLVIGETAQQRDEARAELASIDAVLGRRPALADLEHRVDKISRACAIARTAAEMERDRDDLRAKLDELQKRKK